MNRCCLLLSLALATFATTDVRADKWTQPTPEELSMTSQKEVPGAPAVYLFREEVTEDNLHMWSFYARIKVLSERGKEYGNVELVGGGRSGSGISVSDIAGRTIEPDGTVARFTGKPYEKLITKSRGEKYTAKVFSLPDVRVGSILEYRYVLRWEDDLVIPPSWFAQSDLFTRRAHFFWKPTERQLTTNGQLANAITWVKTLPAGADFKKIEPAHTFLSGAQTNFELNIENVPPAPDEDFMPPTRTFTFRVLFSYSPYRSGEEFWKKEGDIWTKYRNQFIGPGPAISAAAREITQGETTSEAKLRKLYAAVQKLENVEYSRTHTSAEDRAEGLREIRTAEDILQRKRGDGDQLAQLFVALARGASFKAYLMAVTNRDRSIFSPALLSFGQLNDYIAIVNVDGKDVFLDPGSPFVAYGQLAWKHDRAGGVRQTDSGAEIAYTPASNYTASRILRVANLVLAGNGLVSGTVKFTFIGSPAVYWRQRALVGDEESLRRELTEHLESELSAGIEPHLEAIEQPKQSDQPLTVSFTVRGHPGSATSKRLLLPGEIFEGRTSPTFPHEKREIGVYFEYPKMMQDAIRINFPSTFAVESIPTPAKFVFEKSALYELKTESTPTSVTIRRTYVLGEVIFQAKEYPELRTFYGDFEGKDQQPIVLKQAATTPAQTSEGGGGF